MDYCILVIQVDLLWMVTARSITLYPIPHLNAWLNTIQLPLFATVVLHANWAFFEGAIVMRLNQRNVRIHHLLYTLDTRLLTHRLAHALWTQWPPPAPLNRDWMLVPPCIPRPSHRSTLPEECRCTRHFSDYQCLICCLEKNTPRLTRSRLMALTTGLGNWFLSVRQVAWAELRLKQTAMRPLKALAAQVVNLACVPSFLKEAVVFEKKIFLLALIKEWRASDV